MKHPMEKLLTFFLILISCTGNSIGQNAQTPMMGWSSWNTFRININEDLIRQTADALVEKGLKEAGYTFVNIDDGFFAGRDSLGNLKNNDTKFPNGMKAVADYIHRKGLKAGIYSEAGSNTCGYKWDNDKINGSNVGFYGHEEKDAHLYFKTWGYDFIKIDYCGAEDQRLDEKTQYTKIRNAIQQTGRTDVRLNICRWMFPGTWAGEIANSWRIAHDIRNNFNGTLGVRDILEHNLYLSAYATPGHFNDMDMMQVGRGMTEDEEKSHFGLWCIMNSPLMIGCDLRTIPSTTLDIITNREIIAVNQDVLGLQAQVVNRNGKQFVLAKSIEKDQGKIRAVALFNAEDSAQIMRIDFKEIQLSEKAYVRDLWKHQDLGAFTSYYEVSVPAHGIAMLRIEGESSFDKTIFEGEDAYINEYNAIRINQKIYDKARFSEKQGASGGYVLKDLGGRNKPDNWAEFRRVYSSSGGTCQFDLFYYSGTNTTLSVIVNGQAYPMKNLNSGNDTIRGNASVKIKLNPGYNVIRLANPDGPAPVIDKFELHNVYSRP